MRKWAFFVAAAVAVIGCGGSGSDRSGTGSTSGGTTGGSNLTVNLNQSFGTVGFTFLTGQGRNTGDLTAVVRRLELEDSDGVVRTDLEAPHRLPLAEYVLDVLRLNVPFTGQSGRLFESFPLTFTEFLEETGAPSAPTFESRTPPASEQVPARIRVIPGRDTSLPIFLDDSMFSSDGNAVTFNRDQFNLRNNLTDAGSSIQTFFSDYVAFDISGMAAADRPLLSNGQRASRLFVSGDNYALGDTPGTSQRFEVLTLDSAEPIVGTFGDEGTLGGRQTPGTYTLYQTNPTDIQGLLQITALAGVWRDSTRAFSNTSTFDFILFPTSRFAPADASNGNGLRPDEDQEVAIVQRNASGAVTNFYFGYADLDTRTFTAYPLSQIVTADTAGEVTGTLSNYVNANGGATGAFDLIRRGRFTFTGGAPSGFPNTGTFTIYRK